MDIAELEQQWESIRNRFRHSLMENTKLSSLAENADLPAWPIEGVGETPGKYIDFFWEDIDLLPELHEDDYANLKLLIQIMDETLAFDDPFGAMTEQGDAESVKDDTMKRCFTKLGIPEDFPLELCKLSAETQEFCDSQGFATVTEFVDFFHHAVQSLVIKGDYRHFLNALANYDEAVIATILPIRPGETGVHLQEGSASQCSR